MPKRSAGLLLYRATASGDVEVLIVHPGGPLWASKDAGVWSVPKGEYEDGEDPLATALREFEEELGQPAPDGDLIDLGEVRQQSGKRVQAWAIEGEVDVASVRSNTFELEWPPSSGRVQAFPEIDRASWETIAAARVRLLAAQTPFLDRLDDALRARG